MHLTPASEGTSQDLDCSCLLFSQIKERNFRGFSFKALRLSPESSEVAWKRAEFVHCVGDPQVFILFVATKVSMTDNFYLICPNGLIPSRDTHGQNGNRREKWQPDASGYSLPSEERKEDGKEGQEQERAEPHADGSRSGPVAAA